MKRKLLWFLALCVVAAGAALVGCSGNNSGETSGHKHTIDTEADLLFDESGHWHRLSCGHDDVIDKEKHTLYINEWNGGYFLNEEVDGGDSLWQGCSECEYTFKHDCAKCERVTYLEYGTSGHYAIPACLEEHSWANDVPAVLRFWEEFGGTEPQIQAHTYKDGKCTACNFSEWNETFDYYVSSEGDEKFIVIDGVVDSAVTELIVPETIDGLPVKRWEAKNKLEFVRPENKFTSVTFANLERVVFPASIDFASDYDGSYLIHTVENTCKGLFMGCEKLKSVEMAGVSCVPDGMFTGCKALTDVAVSDNAARIGGSAFEGCEALTTVTIPASVTEIGDSAFSGCKLLQDVTLPEKLTVIGERMFYGCEALTTVTIPASVTEIGDSAFNGCKLLQNVTLPEKLTVIGVAAFESCEALTTVTIPAGVTEIGDSAFSGCKLLQDVTLPEKLTVIGAAAFKGCEALTALAIPVSVTEIGVDAFWWTPVAITYAGTVDDWCGIKVKYAFNTQTCTLTCMDGAFSGEQTINALMVSYSYLSFVKLQDGTYEVSGVSDGMPEFLIIPETYRGKEVTRIAENGFKNFNKLRNVRTGDNVTEVGDNAFNGCTAIDYIFIGAKTQRIGRNAFNGCKGLGSSNLVVSFAENSVLQTVDMGAFDQTTLKSLALPDSVSEFGGISVGQLTEITFSKNITRLTQYMFYGSRNISVINFHGTAEEWNAIVKEAGWNHADHAGTLILKLQVKCSDQTIQIN